MAKKKTAKKVACVVSARLGFWYDGKNYGFGEELKLNDKDAKRLANLNVITIKEE